MQSLPGEIQQRQEQIAQYQKVVEGVETLRDEIYQFPEILRAFLFSSLSGSPQPRPNGSPGFPGPDTGQALNVQQMVQQPLNMPQQVQQQAAPALPPDPCGGMAGEEQTNCQVHQFVLAQFDNYGATLRDNVLVPLKSLQNEASLHFDPSILEQGLQQLQSSFKRLLDENPRFWKTYSGKEGFSVRLSEQVSRFWAKYDSVIRNESRHLEKELGALQASKDRLEDQKKALSGQEEVLSTRLSQIESPLGKLPVGLVESVLFFPVLLAIGFLVSTGQFAELIRLRSAFHRLALSKDPARHILTDQQIALTAPLWLDPADHEQKKVIPFLILFAPAFIFVVACGLIFYVWSLPDALSGSGVLNRWVYGALYLVSAGFIVYAALQGRSGVRNYSPAAQEA
ncbi:MAG: hypothetical protein D6743_12300 [Calditrichaeota bacterium]|nr:MAG: hypothetical protein D6743_12300 [Calditrichota bacterium]